MHVMEQKKRGRKGLGFTKLLQVRLLPEQHAVLLDYAERVHKPLTDIMRDEISDIVARIETYRKSA